MEMETGFESALDEFWSDRPGRHDMSTLGLGPIRLHGESGATGSAGLSSGSATAMED